MEWCSIDAVDEDLYFLCDAQDEELEDLVNCLIYDKDTEERFIETLSLSEEYKTYPTVFYIALLRKQTRFRLEIVK